MMIGTPTASSLWPAYLLTVFSVVAGFAVYDILYRRVPDRALAFFMPFAALAPLLKVCLAGDGGQLWPTVAEALAGALLGFCIPLAAAMATGGTGLGGGDIKFCGILGLIYGPSGMALVFFVAAVFAMPMVLLFRRLSRLRQPIAIPFLPFLACGCSVATLLYFLNEDWFHTLLFTTPGKIALAICAAIILFALTQIMKLSRPIEYGGDSA